jgi:hypothetical protein
MYAPSYLQGDSMLDSSKVTSRAADLTTDMVTTWEISGFLPVKHHINHPWIAFAC